MVLVSSFFAYSFLIVALIQVFKIICLIHLRLIGCIFASVILITRGIYHNIAFLLNMCIYIFSRSVFLGFIAA